MRRIMFYAPDPQDGANGGGALSPEALQKAELVIVDEMVLPVASRGAGGARGSKYLPKNVLESIAKLEPKQGLVIPFMENGAVLDSKKRQNTVTKYYINEQAKAGKKEGEAFAKYSTAIVDGGIAVRRDS